MHSFSRIWIGYVGTRQTTTAIAWADSLDEISQTYLIRDVFKHVARHVSCAAANEAIVVLAQTPSLTYHTLDYLVDHCYDADDYFNDAITAILAHPQATPYLALGLRDTYGPGVDDLLAQLGFLAGVTYQLVPHDEDVHDDSQFEERLAVLSRLEAALEDEPRIVRETVLRLGSHWPDGLNALVGTARGINAAT